MDRKALMFCSLAALAGATGATAQVVSHPFGAYPGATISEQHRYEMDRLRAHSDQQDALARQQRLDTRLTLMELQARRQPAPVEIAPYYATQTPTLEQQRARREAATIQSKTVLRGVSQIDAWLDRSPR